MQTTMDQFYKTSPKSSYDIYYVDWNEAEPHAHWLIKKPASTLQHMTFESNVNWKDGGYPVTLCCSDVPNNTPFVIPKETVYHNVALIRSLLQKCVRRQLTDLALRTAWHFIKMDAQAFIRRLFVIMLEDVDIHPCLSTIVWLTSATSKGYSLTESQVKWLMGIVKYLCEDSRKFYRGRLYGDKLDIRRLLRNIGVSHVDDSQRDVLYSILFRSGYGGLPGDLCMFYDYAVTWLEKFTLGQQLMCPPIQELSLNFSPLKLQEILTDGVVVSADFHCFPQILTTLVEYFPQFTELQIKKAIWEYSSKINTRGEPRYPSGSLVNTDQTDLLHIWDTIKEIVHQTQSNLIKYHH
jgi:hypothetical protein